MDDARALPYRPPELVEGRAVPSYYDVLGVPEGATETDIARAYRDLAKLFHPDQHPGASSAERAQYEQAMARINEAYNVLKDDAKRSEYSFGLRAENVRERPDETSYRPPNGQECMFCGCGPAAPFRFEHQHAWVIAGTRYTNEATLCRDCAQSLGRASQNRTLLAGWYGVLAIFRNLAIVWRNTVALRRANQLAEPRWSSEVVAPLMRPLHPGKPLFGRAGVYVSAVLLVVGISAAASSDQQAQQNSSTSGGSNANLSLFNEVSWEMGACVDRQGSYFTPVDCGPSSDGRVVAVRRSQSDCPFSAEYYVEDGSSVYCIDSR